jgi:SPP1 family predicted phage head-tail adaptor
MRAGRLDRRVTLQSRVLTRNSQGEEVVTYTDLGDVWAEKQDLRGREYFTAQQVSADISTRWRIRYVEGLTALNRLVYEGINYDIQHVAEIGRREGLELFTRAVVA